MIKTLHFKATLICLLLLIETLCLHTFSQTTITVQADQAEILSVNAGVDSIIFAGEHVSLGTTPAATGGALPYTYKWSPEKGLDNPIISNPTVAVVSETTFTVTVMDANGCVATDDVTIKVKSATALNENSISRFSVYPNPSSGFVMAELPASPGIYILRLMTIEGRLLWEQKIPSYNNATNYRFSIASFTPGVYLLAVTDGNFNQVMKLVKE